MARAKKKPEPEEKPQPELVVVEGGAQKPWRKVRPAGPRDAAFMERARVALGSPAEWFWNAIEAQRIEFYIVASEKAKACFCVEVVGDALVLGGLYREGDGGTMAGDLKAAMAFVEGLHPECSDLAVNVRADNPKYKAIRRLHERLGFSVFCVTSTKKRGQGDGT